MARLAFIAAAGLILAGCGANHASTPPARPHYPVVVRSPTVTAAPRFGLHHFVQFVSPTRLAITTWGSSSCPSVPDELVYQSPHRIRVHLTVGSWDGGKPVARTPSACTLDYGTTRMTVTIDPKLVDVHRPLTVLFVSKGSTRPIVRIAAPLS